MKDNSLMGIALVGAAVWLLFLGGCEAIQRATTNYTTSGQPAVAAIQTGIQRLQATPQVQISAPAASQAPIVAPQVQAVIATPAPALPTAIVVAQAQAAQVEQAPAPIRVIPQPLPTAEPTAVPPTPTAQYPSANLRYEVRTAQYQGYEAECVYIFSLNKRVCAAPDSRLKDVEWIVGMVEAGHIPGDPIPDGE